MRYNCSAHDRSASESASSDSDSNVNTTKAAAAQPSKSFFGQRLCCRPPLNSLLLTSSTIDY